MDNSHCPAGPGGNVTIVNQDEKVILDATVASVPVRAAALATEDDSHVNPAFRGGDVAGS